VEESAKYCEKMSHGHFAHHKSHMHTRVVLVPSLGLRGEMSAIGCAIPFTIHVVLAQKTSHVVGQS